MVDAEYYREYRRRPEVRKKNMLYYWKNREQILEETKKRYDPNKARKYRNQLIVKERVKEYMKKYYQQHKEILKNYQKARYHSPHGQKLRKEWDKKNWEKRRRYRRKYYLEQKR